MLAYIHLDNFLSEYLNVISYFSFIQPEFSINFIDIIYNLHLLSQYVNNIVITHLISPWGFGMYHAKLLGFTELSLSTHP